MVERGKNMKLQKLFLLPLLVASLSLFSCSSKDSESSSNSESSTVTAPSTPETTVHSRTIDVNYGRIQPDKALHLLDGSIIPFALADYNADYLVAGDLVSITYEGLVIATSQLPSNLIGKILDVEVKHTTIFAFEVAENPGGGTSLRPIDGQTCGSYETRYCITEDGTYLEDILNNPIGTKIYGVCNYGDETKKMIAFYNFNPIEKPVIIR